MTDDVATLIDMVAQLISSVQSQQNDLENEKSDKIQVAIAISLYTLLIQLKKMT